MRYDAQTQGYWYDRLTVTGPNGYNMAYDMRVSGRRNVMTRITDSLGRVTTVDFDQAYRPTRLVQPEGNETVVDYDRLGNIVTRTTKPKPGLGSRRRSARPPTTPISGCNGGSFEILCFRPTWFRDGLGRQTDFAYNSRGQLDRADRSGRRRAACGARRTSRTSRATGLSRRSVTRVCGDVSTCGTADEIRTEYEYWGNTFLPIGRAPGSMPRAARRSRRDTRTTSRAGSSSRTVRCRARATRSSIGTTCTGG